MTELQERTYIPFTQEMKKDYTILVPTMLPRHFELVISVMETYGYKMELLQSSGPEIAEIGLKYVHNDACYPAILVIGQFMEAILSGRYDTHKLALVLFQTGGGCRASNYISLLRKALARAGYDYVPVISLSFTGIEKHPGLNMSWPLLKGILYAVLYGDLLLTLVNQCKPYERDKGSTEALAQEWTIRLGQELGSGKKIQYRKIKKNYQKMLEDFAALPKTERNTVKVGVVGEIFVKYSPLGNNNLEQFLVDEGAEVVVPGLVDFGLYCLYNFTMDYKLYGKGFWSSKLFYVLYKLLTKMKQDISKIMAKHGQFTPLPDFNRTIAITQGYIGMGAKMGEGWLLTAEMLELAENGIKNIVCTQPFGCLPNHICGKGMMRPIKNHNPDVNIVAIDYDAGATKVNQENRLKLMLANAK